MGQSVSQIIEELIGILVPALLKISSHGDSLRSRAGDPSWVLGFVTEIISLIQRDIPAWLAPTVPEIEQLVAAALQQLLNLESAKH